MCLPLQKENVKVKMTSIDHRDPLLEELFKGKSFVTINDIKALLEKRLKTRVSPEAIRQRILRWKQKGYISSIRRGVYRKGTLSNLEIHKALSNKSNAVIKLISDKYQYLEWSIWNTNILNEFLRHQINWSMNIVEVEPGYEEALFDFLKDRNIRCFLKPTSNMMQRYVQMEKEPYVLIPLISKAPLNKVRLRSRSFQSPKLEKILVDVFTDQSLFGYIHRSELRHFFKTAFDEYNIDIGTLLTYSKRRGQKIKIEHFLRKNDIKIPGNNTI